MTDNAPNWDSIEPVIIAWGEGRSPSSTQQRQIESWAIQNNLPTDSDHARSSPSNVWQLTPQNVNTAITQRAALLQTLVQRINEGEVTLPIANTWQQHIQLLWTLWLPLAQKISQQQKAIGRPFIQGILGGQGTGKTTLCKILQLILESMGHRTAQLSIDDLYLTYAQRQQLRQQDPRLIWRGPPGTHDVALGIKTLQSIKQAAADTAVVLPQFDKSLHEGMGDRTTSQSIPAPDILLFEGWFVGTKPIAADHISADNFTFPPPISTAQEKQFARDCNNRLRDYLPLWTLIDDLMVLSPHDYRLSLQWRQQAERDMIATGKTGLSKSDIVSFVTYFWQALHPRLFIIPLTQNAATGLVVELDAEHQPVALYSHVYSPEKNVDTA